MQQLPQPSSLQAKAKRLMQKAKKNMRKINFKKAVTQIFREYDQKLEALTNFNVSEAFENAIQARVLTEIKKLLPTHIPKALANYVKPCLNNYVLEVMQNNQINLLTKPSTSTDDLSKMDLKTKLLNRIHLNKKDKPPVVHAQDDTPAIQPIDQEDEYVQNHPNPEWFPKKSWSANAKRRMTWFDLLLKSDIDQNENHILGPSTIAIAKKLKALIQKDELTIANLKAVLSEAKWNSDEDDASKPRSFERHMSKNTKPHPSFYNNDFYYLVSLSTEEKYTTSLTKHYAARYYIQGIEDMISDRWCKKTHNCHFEALNGIHHCEDSRIDFFKAEMSTNTEEKIYSDLRIKSVV
ncbi:hypothetical protein Tco_0720839 [Tanacetum coccineum]